MGVCREGEGVLDGSARFEVGVRDLLLFFSVD